MKIKICRVFCVGLPLVLTFGAFLLIFVPVLYGFNNPDFYVFRLDTEDLSLSPSSIQDVPDKLVSLDSKNPLSLLGLENITATKLQLADTYSVNLFGYCTVESNNKTFSCGGHKFDWASDVLTITSSGALTFPEGLTVTLPDKLAHIVKSFEQVSKFTQIVTALAIFGLVAEIAVGIRAICSRVSSCLAWVLAVLVSAFVGVAAALTTVQAAFVVGAVKATREWHGADGQINGGYLATIWISFGFHLAASWLWLFPTCCCRPA
jgi:hypothetical protein